MVTSLLEPFRLYSSPFLRDVAVSSYSWVEYPLHIPTPCMICRPIYVCVPKVVYCSLSCDLRFCLHCSFRNSVSWSPLLLRLNI
jgi:hypothetical protein